MSSRSLLRDLHALPLMERIGAAASGQPLYATGGFLRDRLAGRVPKAELDLTLPDPRRLLRRFTLRKGESLFLMDAERDTYRLVFARPAPFLWVDITRLRAESIAEDLLLRDFTVNALAVEIGGGGGIIDPAGGREDLGERLLRHCSPRSFRDDPLRLLRGVRFEANLGFRFAGETLRLMEGSRRGITSVAAERVRDELFQVLQGPAPLKGLKRIGSLRLLRHLGRPFDDTSPPSPPRRLGRLLSLLGEFHPRSSVTRKLDLAVDQIATRRGMLVLAAWLLDRDAADRAGHLLCRLALGKKAEASLRGGLEATIPLSHLRHPGSIDREALLDLFHKTDEAVEEAALLRACSISPAGAGKEAAAAFLRRYATVRKTFLRPPLLPGAAVLASLPVAPGPELGALLAAVRRAQDLGRVRTRAGALRWARERLAASV